MNLPLFNASRSDRQIINAIATRAVKMAATNDIDYDKTCALMDLEACHCNGCELDLAKLRDAGDADFGHDVFGIRRFIDRRTGYLTECFVPRCAMPA